MAFFLSPPRQREFTHTTPIICYCLVTNLAVPFLPLVAVCLLSHVKSSPNIDLRSLILATVPVRSPSAGSRSETGLLSGKGKLKEELDPRRSKGEFVDPDFVASRIADLEAEAYRQEKEVLATYGMLMQSSEGADPHIAPLRRALAVWGLTADDISVLSIHGTSTQANEKNEAYMWNTILKTLDRSPRNAIPIMAQKSLVGHSKVAQQHGRWRVSSSRSGTG